MSPQDEALWALYDFLKDNGFVCTWGLGLSLPHKSYGFTVRCPKLYSDALDSDLWKVCFCHDGDLMVMRAGTKLAPLTVSSKRMCLDLGAQFFELADPSLFDQLLGFLNGGVRGNVGGEWVIDG